MGPLVGGGLLSCDYFREDRLSELIIADIVLSCKGNSAISHRIEGKRVMAKEQGTKEDRTLGAHRGIMTRVNQRGWKDLKMLAVERGVTLNALAVEAFNDLLKKYGKKASVENPLIS